MPVDTDRLLADVELLRQYFIAKDLTGQVRGLAETLVHAHTMRLHAVVELMKRSSDSLVVMFLATAGGPVCDTILLRYPQLLISHSLDFCPLVLRD